MTKVISFYLPQFYPTPENDEWWGKGFTEWTNVGRAVPLFKGHYQPRVPADLGYYDLRIPEVREQQAELAKEAGIYGFCYWHYWFAGDLLLNRVFDEVVQTKKPDFPFCLCWANHSWKAKTWDSTIPDKMLKEQTYPGAEDYKNHFLAMLPAFKDSRYIKTNDGRLLFGIFDPACIPDMEVMVEVWNGLAEENGLNKFCFFAFCQGEGNINNSQGKPFDMIVYDAMFDAVFQNLRTPLKRIMAKIATISNKPLPLEYSRYSQIALKQFKEFPEAIPCIDPNFDHSPRSGAKGTIIHNSTPTKWGSFCNKVYSIVQERKDSEFLFIKAWNEWGEGNYMEPDMRFGKGFIEEAGKVFRHDEG